MLWARLITGPTRLPAPGCKIFAPAVPACHRFGTPVRHLVWIFPATLLVVVGLFFMRDDAKVASFDDRSGSQTDQSFDPDTNGPPIATPKVVGRQESWRERAPVGAADDSNDGTRSAHGSHTGPAAGAPVAFIEPPIPDSPSFRPRWSDTGLCEEAAPALKARATVRDKFRHEVTKSGEYFIDPKLEISAERLEPMVEQARRLVKQFFQLEPPAVALYVYRDGKLLQATSCVPDHVIAYYDGAIHIVWQDVEAVVAESVAHEFVHHALFSEKIFTPMWLHEGAAILLAGEEWWRSPERIDTLDRAPLPLGWMVPAFPYKSSEELALRVYTQAASMATLVASRADNGVVGSAHAEPLADVVRKLKNGESTPASAFADALGLAPADAWRLWRKILPEQVRR